MVEAAEESDKENYRNGWPPGGRKFSEIDRESPAARKATEKENYRGGRQRQAGWRNFSEKYREPPRDIRNIGLAGPAHACFWSPPYSAWPRGIFQTEEPAQGKRPQLRSRLEEEFRARLGRLIVRTALPRRHSPDARHLVISSAKELFFYFLCCSEASAVERRRLTLGIADEKAHAVSGGPLFDIFCVDQFRS